MIETVSLTLVQNSLIVDYIIAAFQNGFSDEELHAMRPHIAAVLRSMGADLETFSR